MKDSHDIPVEFDWVSARQGCSLQAQFNFLESGAREDIVRRNGVSDGLTIRSESTKFTVMRINRPNADRLKTSVIFRLKDNCISIEDITERVIFQATETLNDHNECVFKIDGEEVRRWQILKRALEELFFDI